MHPKLRPSGDFDPQNPFNRVVLGTASLGGLRGPVDRDEAVGTVLAALESGVCRIDTAPAYGDAEQIVGEALARWSGPRPWISTKAGKTWKAGTSRFDYDPSTIIRNAENSCQLLGVKHLDCLFVHEPEFIPEGKKRPLVDGLNELKKTGLVKMAGLGGGSAASWRWLLDTGVFSAAISFNRLSAVTSEALEQDLPELQRVRAMLFGGSLLHAGLLGDRAELVRRRPPAYLSAETLRTAQRLGEFASNAGVSLGALAHRFALSISELDFLILGSANRAQLDATLAALREGPLDRDRFTAICALQE